MVFIKDWYRESYSGEIYEKKHPDINKLIAEIDVGIELAKRSKG